MPNPFSVLGVAETDPDDTIKKAYLQQVREHPPERDSERFQIIRAAYEAIKTHQDRLRYRLFGQQAPDLAGLMTAALHAGPSRRPTESQVLQVLRNRLTTPK
jgi:DnaJ-class molecular chaperone